MGGLAFELSLVGPALNSKKNYKNPDIISANIELKTLSNNDIPLLFNRVDFTKNNILIDDHGLTYGITIQIECASYQGINIEDCDAVCIYLRINNFNLIKEIIKIESNKLIINVNRDRLIEHNIDTSEVIYSDINCNAIDIDVAKIEFIISDKKYKILEKFIVRMLNNMEI